MRETMEDGSDLVARDPDAGIRDGNTQGTGHFRLRNRLHSNHHFALLRKFDRIPDQAHEDLPQTCWIAKD